MDYNAVREYIKKAKIEADKAEKAREINLLKELKEDGVINEDMTLDEIKEIARALNEDEQIDEKKSTKIKKYIEESIKKYKPILESMLNKNKDLFTGDPVSFTEKERILANELLEIDPNDLSYKDGLKLEKAISNAITNQVFDGVATLVAKSTGIKNAEIHKKDKKSKIHPLSFISVGATNVGKTAAKLYGQAIMTMPMFITNLYKGMNGALEFERLSGFNSVARGKVRARKKVESITKTYINKFGKLKDFFTPENVFERGLFAYIRRHNPTEDVKAEFKRRKDLLKESIDELNKYGTKEQKDEAAIMQSTYDRLLKDADNIADVEAKVSDNNKKAVNFWTNEFEVIFPDIQEVASTVYNTILNKEADYSKDTFKNITQKDLTTEEKIEASNQSAFMSNNNIDSESSGGMKELIKPQTLKKEGGGRYVSLNYDMNMVSAMNDALTDVNTAKEIVQLVAFMDSNQFRDKFNGNNEDLNLLKNRISSFVTKIKNKDYNQEDLAKDAIGNINKIGKMVTVAALGGLAQPVKQVVPVVANTIINASGKGFNIPTTGEVSRAQNHINRSITGGRGIAATSDISNELTSLKYKLSPAGKTTNPVKKLGRLLSKGHEAVLDKGLELLIEKPDKAAAQWSWVAYYKKSMKQQGKLDGDIWEDERFNETASNYADAMVARQQNVSMPEMMGELFSSKKSTHVIARKVLFPFANFAMNVKARIWTDARIISSLSSSPSEKISSIKSLAGTSAELVIFKAIGSTVASVLGAAVMSVIDSDELDEMTEEEKEKYWDDYFKNEYKKFKKSLFSNAVSDVLSPVPISDKFSVKAANEVAKFWYDTREGEEEVPEEDRIYGYDEEYGFGYGLLGIGVDKVLNERKLIDMAVDFGDQNVFYTSGFKRGIESKSLSDDDKELAKTFASTYGLYLTGLLPREAGQLAEKGLYALEKKAKKADKEKKSEEYSTKSKI
jgi:hypothetical protein